MVAPADGPESDVVIKATAVAAKASDERTVHPYLEWFLTLSLPLTTVKEAAGGERPSVAVYVGLLERGWNGATASNGQ